MINGRNFKRRGIKTHDGMRCIENGAGLVRLSGGREIPADMAFVATGPEGEFL